MRAHVQLRTVWGRLCEKLLTVVTSGEKHEVLCRKKVGSLFIACPFLNAYIIFVLKYPVYEHCAFRNMSNDLRIYPWFTYTA